MNFRVELLKLVALFEILANVNGIGECIGISEDVCRLIATVSSVTTAAVSSSMKNHCGRKCTAHNKKERRNMCKLVFEHNYR